MCLSQFCHTLLMLIKQRIRMQFIYTYIVNVYVYFSKNPIGKKNPINLKGFAQKKFYKVEVIKIYFTNYHLLVVHDSVILKILNSLDECTNKNLQYDTKLFVSAHIVFTKTQ